MDDDGNDEAYMKIFTWKEEYTWICSSSIGVLLVGQVRFPTLKYYFFKVFLNTFIIWFNVPPFKLMFAWTRFSLWIELGIWNISLQILQSLSKEILQISKKNSKESVPRITDSKELVPRTTDNWIQRNSLELNQLSTNST